MTLPEDLEKAARAFGLKLRDHPLIQEYLAAKQKLEADAEARALDERCEAMRLDLVARQQAGEMLPRAEVDTYYALNRQARAHPLIAERDRTLQAAKAYLVQVGQDLSVALGVDYTALAID
ncbi:MAG: hypothetical protein Kow00124_12510 [Anaerolineae bacterium]